MLPLWFKKSNFVLFLPPASKEFEEISVSTGSYNVRIQIFYRFMHALCCATFSFSRLGLIFVPELHNGSAGSDEGLDSFKSPSFKSDKIKIIRKSTYSAPGLGIHTGPK